MNFVLELDNFEFPTEIKSVTEKKLKISKHRSNNALSDDTRYS